MFGNSSGFNYLILIMFLGDAREIEHHVDHQRPAHQRQYSENAHGKGLGKILAEDPKPEYFDGDKCENPIDKKQY